MAQQTASKENSRYCILLTAATYCKIVRALYNTTREQLIPQNKFHASLKRLV